MAINPTIRDLYNDPDSFVLNSQNQKYDKDIRGGGYSGQPFIKTPPQGQYKLTRDQLNNLTTEALSLDYPIRGGSYEELAARQDFARIDRFLLSYPQGKAFLDKQKGLMFSNPKMESRKSGGFANTRTYSDGRNLMTQIAEGGTGFHHPNAGRTLRDLELEQNKYEYVVSHKPKELNRLVTLTNVKINKQTPSDFLFGSQASELGINTVDNGELFFYTGGPGSLYGLGNTIIQRARDSYGVPIDTSQAPLFIGPNFINDQVTGKNVQGRPLSEIDYSKLFGVSEKFNLSDKNGLTADNDSLLNIRQQSSPDYVRADKVIPENTYFNYTMGYSKIRERQPIKPGSTGITDFRSDSLEPNSVQKRDYNSRSVNITRRVGIGNPGARPLNQRTNTNQIFQDGQDKVNMYDLQDLTTPEGIAGFSKIEENRDLIKFVFETVNNDAPTTSKAAFFRAFLTNYADSHNANWNAERYTGRGENFYTYQGFDRTVSFSFKIAAQSKQEMKFLYKKLNYLLSTLYPDYNGNGFMRGNITKLTLGDLFVRTPGILENIDLSVDDSYAWEIALNEPEGGSDKDMLETPQIMDVSATFKPILNRLPRKGGAILLTAGEEPGNNAYKYLNATTANSFNGSASPPPSVPQANTTNFPPFNLGAF